MIAVAPKPGDENVVSELFELFKTPWRFHSEENPTSDVLICSDTPPANSAKLVLIYSGKNLEFDRLNAISLPSQSVNTVLAWENKEIPVYGSCASFNGKPVGRLVMKHSGKSVATKMVHSNQTVIRIGYDLFGEIRHLLTCGQPPEMAKNPSLEWHVSWLRNIILSESIPLLEIPPIPVGKAFIACLTHDVDHTGIANHKWDHTLAGFLYRATVGTALDVSRGRKTTRQMFRNWTAAFTLPFVHLGMAKDFWYSFDRYLEIEKGMPSTFFVIPKKGESGLDSKGNRPHRRAASYDAEELKEHLDRVRKAGHEVGVHGIDAWRDESKGAEELERISQITGSAELGVRMHWLYFDEQSPSTLEAAGFSYDSTIGYNETVGFRAGTTQVFKPLTTNHLLELPMHVMDTALFYPSYLNLTSASAASMVHEVMAQTAAYGGVLTVNWHDRSIMPERLWDDFYIELLRELKTSNPWFATAAQTVAWFRKRRSVTFEETVSKSGTSTIRVFAEFENSTPALKVRIHKPGSGGFTDIPLTSGCEISLGA